VTEPVGGELDRDVGVHQQLGRVPASPRPESVRSCRTADSSSTTPGSSLPSRRWSALPTSASIAGTSAPIAARGRGAIRPSGGTSQWLRPARTGGMLAWTCVGPRSSRASAMRGPIPP
jgi:hypothetical protein